LLEGSCAARNFKLANLREAVIFLGRGGGRMYPF
jgi:hypothetical protein